MGVVLAVAEARLSAQTTPLRSLQSTTLQACCTCSDKACCTRTDLLMLVCDADSGDSTPVAPIVVLVVLLLAIAVGVGLYMWRRRVSKANHDRMLSRASTGAHMARSQSVLLTTLPPIGEVTEEEDESSTEDDSDSEEDGEGDTVYVDMRPGVAARAPMAPASDMGSVKGRPRVVRFEDEEGRQTQWERQSTRSGALSSAMAPSPRAPSPGFARSPRAPSPGFARFPRAPSPGYPRPPSPGYGRSPRAPSPSQGRPPLSPTKRTPLARPLPPPLGRATSTPVGDHPSKWWHQLPAVAHQQTPSPSGWSLDENLHRDEWQPATPDVVSMAAGKGVVPPAASVTAYSVSVPSVASPTRAKASSVRVNLQARRSKSPLSARTHTTATRMTVRLGGDDTSSDEDFDDHISSDSSVDENPPPGSPWDTQTVMSAGTNASSTITGALLEVSPQPAALETVDDLVRYNALMAKPLSLKKKKRGRRRGKSAKRRSKSRSKSRRKK